MQMTQCPKCDRGLKCTQAYLGKKVKCPNCTHVFVLAIDSLRTAAHSSSHRTPPGSEQPAVSGGERNSSLQQPTAVSAQPREVLELPDEVESDQTPVRSLNSASTRQCFEQMDLPENASGRANGSRDSLARIVAEMATKRKRSNPEIVRCENNYSSACRFLGFFMLATLVAAILAVLADTESKRQIVRDSKYLRLEWNYFNLTILIVIFCIWGAISVLAIATKNRLLVWTVLAMATFRFAGIVTLLFGCGVNPSPGLGVELFVCAVTAILALWCIFSMYRLSGAHCRDACTL